MSSAAADEGNFERARSTGRVSLGLNIAGVVLTIVVIVVVVAVGASSSGDSDDQCTGCSYYEDCCYSSYRGYNCC